MSNKKTRFVRLGLDNAVHYEDCLGEIEVLSELRRDFGKALVDESYFISAVDRAKQTKLAQGSPDVSCYDFPDGNPRGDVDGLAKLHRPDLDIVEVAEIVKLSDEVARKNASDAALSAQMNAIADKVVNTVQKSSNN